MGGGGGRGLQSPSSPPPHMPTFRAENVGLSRSTYWTPNIGWVPSPPPPPPLNGCGWVRCKWVNPSTWQKAIHTASQREDELLCRLWSRLYRTVEKPESFKERYSINPFRTKTPNIYSQEEINLCCITKLATYISLFSFTNQYNLMFCEDKIKYEHLAIISNLKSWQSFPI